MDKLFITEKTSFPLASTWLDKQYQITEQLSRLIADLAGANCIVAGMEINDTNVVSDGLMTLNGELLTFTSGALKRYLVLKTQTTQVQVGSETYTPYERRWIEFADSRDGAVAYYDLGAANAYVFRGVPRLNGYNKGAVKSIVKDFTFSSGCSFTEAQAFVVVNYNVVTIHVRIRGLKYTAASNASIGFNGGSDTFDEFNFPSIDTSSSGTGSQRFRVSTIFTTESGKLMRANFRYRNRIYFTFPSDYDNTNGEDMFFSATFVNHNV